MFFAIRRMWDRGIVIGMTARGWDANCAGAGNKNHEIEAVDIINFGDSGR